MTTPLRPSPLSFDSASGRQSPFKRQNSQSPATARATTPTPQSPTKLNGSLSPTKVGSLSPEKTSPFVRRPSQISHSGERPASPFQRPSSSLSNSGLRLSPSRQNSYASQSEDALPASPRVTPAPEEREYDPPTPSNDTIRGAPSPSPFDGAPSSPAIDSPSAPMPSQASLRPAFQRITTPPSTTSTIKAPEFGSGPKPTSAAPTVPATNFGGGSTYKNVPQPLLRSMRESFEVLDSSNAGSINSASVSTVLEQMGLPNAASNLKDFFPPNQPSQLNLARYLDTLSGPIAELSAPEELLAAFSAFDVDDSGQIDVAELRKAVLSTAPEPGEEDYRLSERDIDSILSEFSGRRAFGAKGVNAAKGKGEVFRYRDFMGSMVGGSGDVGAAEVVA